MDAYFGAHLWRFVGRSFSVEMFCLNAFPLAKPAENGPDSTYIHLSTKMTKLLQSCDD